MGKTAKVAISLPEKVLNEIEKERKARGESRSEFFRKAVEKALREERESADEKQYIRGYTEIPETPEEFQPMEEIGMAVLAEELK